jgi:hypothetical protein
MVRADQETQLVLFTRKARAHDKGGISPCGRVGHFNQLPQAVQKNATREMLPADTAVVRLPLFTDEARRRFDDLRDHEVRRDYREGAIQCTVERGAVELSCRLNDGRAAAGEFTILS